MDFICGGGKCGLLKSSGSLLWPSTTVLLNRFLSLFITFLSAYYLASGYLNHVLHHRASYYTK